MVEDSPAMYVVYVTGIGLTLAALYNMSWSSRRPKAARADRGPSILKALAVGAIVLGIAFSTVIFLASVVEWIVRMGPTDG